MRRYQHLSKEDMIGAGLPEPMADWQSQVYSGCSELGCVRMIGHACSKDRCPGIVLESAFVRIMVTHFLARGSAACALPQVVVK